MNRKRFRKDISHISKRHLNRLAAQESKLICDSLLNTSILSHSNDYENAEYLKNDSTINSHKCYETLAIENDTVSERNNISIKCENDEYIELIESDSEQFSVSISQESVPYIANANTENANTTDDFKNSLAVWATEYQISHTALRALLQRLKQHSCFSKLLLDARSLLQTPRRQEIRIVTPGTYYHFGLLNSVLDILTSIKDNIDCVKIAINIDGLPLSKSSSQQLWPILGSVLSYDNIFLIGLDDVRAARLRNGRE
ncbi:uncharacterized protein [Polyergus mexicanus]|uniref:uncharacterized protein n=1 Tax=Polyergus mexicanus TaxID=615972 RepID=UPI0038B4632F